jgi:isoquinoline 1-oxidoreductase alpha subunit|tara:strand:- start:1186 stop:1680 length:495 start_codon:yes stop_codon:yes gene_type:complete
VAVTLKINGRDVVLDIPDDTPLLWAVRDELDLKGTKFGCGIGMCGACTVHVNGVAQRSCITPVASVADASITTIEGLNAEGEHPLQQAWIATQTPQCGYCQSGQIMQAASLLATNANPTDAEIDTAMGGNLCRCMAYTRIKKAIKMAASAGSLATNVGSEVVHG